MNKIRVKQIDQLELGDFVNGVFSGDIFSINSSISGFSGSVDSFGSQIAILSGNLDFLSGSLGFVSGYANTIETQLGLLSGDFDALSSDFVDLSGQLDILSNALTDLSGTITGADALSTQAWTSLIYVSGNLNTVSASLTAVSTGFSALSSYVTSLNTDYNTFKSGVQSFSGNVVLATGTLMNQVVIESGYLSPISGKIYNMTTSGSGIGLHCLSGEPPSSSLQEKSLAFWISGIATAGPPALYVKYYVGGSGRNINLGTGVFTSF